MLTEDNFKSLYIECESQAENDWEKIEKALDNIKIGELKTVFSLPLEFNKMLEKLPRRIFSSKYYEIGISPKILSLRIKDVSTFSNPQEEGKKPTVTEIIAECEANFKLFLGTYFGVIQKSSENTKTKLEAWFECPLEEKIVSKLKAPILDSLNQTLSKSFVFNGITIYNEAEATSYRITEDLNTQKLFVSIEKQDNSPPTALSFAKILQDIIKQTNDILETVKA
jgi:hypothetical protein